MINGEKYRDELLKFIEKKDAGSFTFSKGEEGKFWQCGGRRCSECGMSKERSNCTVARLKWLLSEYKEPVKLIRVEHEILRYLYKRDYRYIAREESERVIAFKGRPHKITCGTWNTISGEKIGFLNLYDFSNLFQFTDWKDLEPTSIEDVLKNCEVIEDESSK